MKSIDWKRSSELLGERERLPNRPTSQCKCSMVGFSYQLVGVCGGAYCFISHTCTGGLTCMMTLTPRQAIMRSMASTGSASSGMTGLPARTFTDPDPLAQLCFPTML